MDDGRASTSAPATSAGWSPDTVTDDVTGNDTSYGASGASSTVEVAGGYGGRRDREPRHVPLGGELDDGHGSVADYLERVVVYPPPVPRNAFVTCQQIGPVPFGKVRFEGRRARGISGETSVGTR